MTHDETRAIIDELDKLLEKERAALLSGDLDTIARLLDIKSGLVDKLNALEPDNRPALDQLQDKVIRNQALLDGALQGIRNVATRIAAFRKVRETLETYDENGHKCIVEGEVVRQIERRA